MSSVFTDPITGATSISGSLTVDNLNIRGMSLGSTTLSSNAIWLPSTSLQWTPVVAPNLPTFSIPNGGTMTYSRRNAVYRWIGNDVAYNINVAGLLNTQSTVTTGDYTLNVPYPINVAAYGANALIGELWLTTYYQTNSNVFKAYARTIADDANNVTIRVLTGTADVTLTTALSNTTMILQGTMTYNTSSFNQVGGVPAAYLPAAFYQNAAGQVLLNSNVIGGVVAPRGQLDIVYNSNLPALVVDQLGTGDGLQVRKGGVTQLVVSGTGNVGIGTANPTQKLSVVGNIISTGSIDAGTQFLGLAADTAAAPSFSFTGNTTTGMFRGGTNILSLSTASTERVTILANGNVGIGTPNPTATLHVANGDFYSPGSVVQCVTTLYRGVVGYSSPNSGTPTEMTVLNLTIIPKMANNKIILQWMINGETGYDSIFLVYRNTTAIGFNETTGNQQWSGVTVAPRDEDLDSTPQNIIVNWVDSPNTTGSVTYSVRVRTSGSAATTMYVNTNFRNISTGAFERLCSTGVAWEICV